MQFFNSPNGRDGRAVSFSLAPEAHFPDETVAALRAFGHEVDVLSALDETVGHAGVSIPHPNGLLEGASGPRSNGTAAGW